MDLSKILSISGKSGLYKIISQGNNSLIAESLEDGKRFPVFANSPSSKLEDISIFTNEEDLPLKKVLWKIYEAEDGKNSIDHKSDNKSLREYFEKIVPEYDKERVYPSDIKKVIMWYNLLLKHNLITKPEEKEEDKEKEKKSDELTENKEKKEPVKKTVNKNTAEKTSKSKSTSKSNTGQKQVKKG